MIMLKIAVGTLSLICGWLCLNHVSGMRALYSHERGKRSRFYGEKPMMIFPFALGLLFVVDGLMLLALALYEQVRLAGSLDNIVGLEIISLLIIVFIIALALVQMLRPVRYS